SVVLVFAARCRDESPIALPTKWAFRKNSAQNFIAHPFRVNRARDIQRCGRSVIGRVGLFLDGGGVRYCIDAPLERGAPVIEPVDGTCKFDEALLEIALLLQGTQLVLDVPKPTIDLEQLILEAGKVR